MAKFESESAVRAALVSACIMLLASVGCGEEASTMDGPPATGDGDAAAAGGGGSADAPGDGDGAAGGDGDGAPAAVVSYGEVQMRVFAGACAFANTCHGGGAPQLGLDLSGDAHAATVGVMASSAPDRVLIVPGDPDASFLFEKIVSKMPQAGGQMPPTLPLDADRTELLRSWIQAGAPKD